MVNVFVVIDDSAVVAYDNVIIDGENVDTMFKCYFRPVLSSYYAT